MSFFNELKRRNVFRVGAAYLVVAWLLVQVVGELGDIFAMPDVIGQTVVILLAIGFPIALLVSWIYEVTPQGIATQEAVDDGAVTTSGRKLNAVIIGGLALALVLVVMDSYVLDDPAPIESVAIEDEAVILEEEIIRTADLEKTIAVLPFENQSNDQEQQYFSDGLSDELINKLSQVPDLQVAGRNSSFSFRGSDENLSEIGELLDVNFILQGSVRKAGDTVRVTAQLLDTEQGFNLWSDTYERDLLDIFAIQDEIAQEVTTALSITIGAGQFSQVGMTTNVDAYDAYLQGKSLNDSLEVEILVNAITHLERAVALDPEFALAWQQLSWTAWNASKFNDISQRDRFLSIAEDAADTALSLAPEMLEIRINQAAQARYSGDWFQSERILNELDAAYGNTSAQLNMALNAHFRESGRMDDALFYIQKASRLEPDINLYRLLTAWTYALMDDFETFYEIEEELGIFTGQTTFVDMMGGDLEAAKEGSVELAINGEMQIRLLEFLEREDREGGLAFMRERIANMESPTNGRHLRALAALYGEAELALSIRNNGDTLRETLLSDSWMELFSDMRQLPEFKELMERMGLVDYWRSTDWPNKCRPLAGSDDFECF